MDESEQNPLLQELETYQRLLPTLLEHLGEYAVIVGDRLIGTYSTWADACKVGYDEVELGTRFLVKRIEEVESSNFFSRDFASNASPHS